MIIDSQRRRTNLASLPTPFGQSRRVPAAFNPLRNPIFHGDTTASPEPSAPSPIRPVTDSSFGHDKSFGRFFPNHPLRTPFKTHNY
jgi:hypothetical protein